MIPPLTIHYPIDPNAPYGPRHGKTRPYPLPENVRQTSRPGVAAAHIEREAGRVWAGAGGDSATFAALFGATVADIAATASRMMFALPADHIGAHFTFWGVFQFDRAKWQQATYR